MTKCPECNGNKIKLISVWHVVGGNGQAKWTTEICPKCKGKGII